MARQSIRVHIFNQTYSLLADDQDAAALDELANQVDELMTAIANRSSSGDSARVAVLACLHLADKLRAAEKKLKSFEDKSDQIAILLDQALTQG
jgi:cell division protein ZapA